MPKTWTWSQAISDFQNQQTGYDAALKTYSMVQRMSLFQYLELSTDGATARSQPHERTSDPGPGGRSATRR